MYINYHLYLSDIMCIMKRLGGGEVDQRTLEVKLHECYPTTRDPLQVKQASHETVGSFSRDQPDRYVPLLSPDIEPMLG